MIEFGTMLVQAVLLAAFVGGVIGIGFAAARNGNGKPKDK